VDPFVPTLAPGVRFLPQKTKLARDRPHDQRTGCVNVHNPKIRNGRPNIGTPGANGRTEYRVMNMSTWPSG
ncbi:MAG: hypothetical protein VX639_04935, partial [Pseudomonadota bacterium]|nr:hypothetical protein [Pseudomonadota bacterium]